MEFPRNFRGTCTTRFTATQSPCETVEMHTLPVNRITGERTTSHSFALIFFAGENETISASEYCFCPTHKSVSQLYWAEFETAVNLHLSYFVYDFMARTCWRIQRTTLFKALLFGKFSNYLVFTVKQSYREPIFCSTLALLLSKDPQCFTHLFTL